MDQLARTAESFVFYKLLNVLPGVCLSGVQSVLWAACRGILEELHVGKKAINMMFFVPGKLQSQQRKYIIDDMAKLMPGSSDVSIEEVPSFKLRCRKPTWLLRLLGFAVQHGSCCSPSALPQCVVDTVAAQAAEWVEQVAHCTAVVRKADYVAKPEKQPLLGVMLELSHTNAVQQAVAFCDMLSVPYAGGCVHVYAWQPGATPKWYPHGSDGSLLSESRDVLEANLGYFS
eukprot:TRINITY_DN5445_c0_g3_i1.p1 TRINITY_DN5445_c0_g3~~TRINITY_DN5445_c0_g3_i1.p1  ORF type:complete len:230 (+),score=38.78 TRINITY_DN5445_c0_g3_i1:55-744(+)